MNNKFTNCFWFSIFFIFFITFFFLFFLLAELGMEFWKWKFNRFSWISIGSDFGNIYFWSKLLIINKSRRHIWLIFLDVLIFEFMFIIFQILEFLIEPIQHTLQGNQTIIPLWCPLALLLPHLLVEIYFLFQEL